MLRLPRLLLPTGRWVRALLAPVLVFVASAIDRNYQTDLWHHLARGRAIVAEGRLLDTDRFTFTVAGQPLRDVNWGWQVLFYHLDELGGLPLVQAANSAVLALTLAVLVWLAWRRSGSLAAAGGMGVFVVFGLWQLLLIRPQTFSLLLFVLLSAILEEARHRPRLLLLPPLLLALWVNLHGGFPIGLVLIAAHTLGNMLTGPAHPLTPNPSPPQRGRGEEESPLTPNPSLPQRGRGEEEGAMSFVLHAWPWMLCLAASTAATLANPYGWHVYQYVALTSATASGRHIDEWLPPSLNLLAGKFCVLSLVLTLLLLALPTRRPTRRELCLLCCFLPLACSSVRMVAWWLLVSAPILATQFVSLWPRLPRVDDEERSPSLGAALACAGLFLATALSLPWLERFNPVMALPGRAHRVESDLQAVADYLAARQPGGRVFTRFAWGEYLGWSLAPRYTVFMDGRIEIFPDEVWAQYSAVTRGQADWEEILADYDVDCLVLDEEGYHQGLLPQVRRSPCWRQVYRQGHAVLFVRVPASKPTGLSRRPAERKRGDLLK